MGLSLPCLPQKSSRCFLGPHGSAGARDLTAPSPPPRPPSLACTASSPACIPRLTLLLASGSVFPELRVNVPIATPTAPPEPGKHQGLCSCEIFLLQASLSPVCIQLSASGDYRGLSSYDSKTTVGAGLAVPGSGLCLRGSPACPRAGGSGCSAFPMFPANLACLHSYSRLGPRSVPQGSGPVVTGPGPAQWAPWGGSSPRSLTGTFPCVIPVISARGRAVELRTDLSLLAGVSRRRNSYCSHRHSAQVHDASPRATCDLWGPRQG